MMRDWVDLIGIFFGALFCVGILTVVLACLGAAGFMLWHLIGFWAYPVMVLAFGLISLSLKTR